MSRLDQEIMWATSGTGEDFQCVHVDFAREQEAEIERLTAYQNETAKAWTKLTESQEEEIAKLHERCEAYKGQVKSGAIEIERLKADRKELQEVYNALGIGGNMSPVAEIEKLRAALAPFAALGALLKMAGIAAIPDDVSARLLKLDGIQAVHFRAAASAFEQYASSEEKA